MLAAVLEDFDRLELKEAPIPQAERAGEVVVRIKACGFCATDYADAMHPKAIRLMEAGLVDVSKAISHRFPLSRIHEAIEIMASPQRNKIIIQP